MNQRLKYIIILAICIILCNQFIHLYRLHKEEIAQHTHQQNNIIIGAICEFNIKSMDIKNNNLVSFNASNDSLTYQINQQIKSFQLNVKEDNIRQIIEQSYYDIRNPQLWTLKNLYAYLQTKQDSVLLKELSIQLVIQDSTGEIKYSYPEHFETLVFTPKYQGSLGFISGDTLYATYNYPFYAFIQVSIWQIVLTIIISFLFIICIINLYQTIRNEKKSGKYRELFINNLVHDLKRPIQNQIKMCYILRELPAEMQTTLLEESEKDLNKILQSINRMLFQSTDAHGLRLTIQEINLQEMLESLTQKHLWHAEKPFDIRMDYLSDDPIITGDPNFLVAVFQNLVDNALKYSKDQIDIHITCRDLDTRHVQIEIEDNGCGISSQNLKHVFERYHRGDHQGNNKIKGHGQGLHYARLVILAHGGKITINSEKGNGTTIQIILPRKANIKNKNQHEYRQKN